MKTLIFLTVLFFNLNLFSQELPSLVVRIGETKTLYSRTYNYDSILVENGGTLIIKEGSSQWCILWAKGNVTINGQIICKKFIIGPREVSDITPDGKNIKHLYRNNSIGGTGGTGGNTSNGQRVGGLGANGTQQYGGGGGSSGGVVASGHCKYGGNGNNATDWRGARPALYSNGRGGNGGKLSNYCNGGILLIYTSGVFDGTSGVVDLSGENGSNGENTGGSPGGKCKKGPSGPGGGSPGGEGGRLIVISSNFIEYPEVLLDGGKGGKGGSLPNFSHYGATHGQNGEDGQNGIVDFYELSQWQNIKEIKSK